MKNKSKKLKRVGFFGTAWVILFTVFVPILSTGIANAQAGSDNPRFLDRLYVQYDGDTWGNPNPYNDDDYTADFGNVDDDPAQNIGGFTYIRNWTWRDGIDAAVDALSDDGCDDFMSVGDISGTPRATIYLRDDNDFGDCEVTDTQTKDMVNTDVRFVNAYRIDSDNIFAPAGVSHKPEGDCVTLSIGGINRFDLFIPTVTNFRRSDGEARNQYFKIQSSGELTDKVWLETEGGPNAKIVIEVDYCFAGDERNTFNDVVLRNNGDAVSGDAGDCIPRIERPPSKACPDDDPSDPTDPGGGGDDEDGPPSCEEKNPGISLSWFLCSVINFFDNTVQGLTNVVDDLLQIDAAYYTDANLKTAWSYFRNIASFLLIVIGLVMIIGQAITKG